MYALTNKRDHAAQIAKRYMRLVRAQLRARVADRKLLQLRKKTTATLTSKSRESQGETSTGSGKGKVRAMRRVHLPAAHGDDPLGFEGLDVHHCISTVRRKPLDMYDYFSATKGDPAMIVSYLCPFRTPSEPSRLGFHSEATGSPPGSPSQA